MAPVFTGSGTCPRKAFQGLGPGPRKIRTNNTYEYITRNKPIRQQTVLPRCKSQQLNNKYKTYILIRSDKQPHNDIISRSPKVHDFSLIFDAYTKFLESLVTAHMEPAPDLAFTARQQCIG